MSQSQLNLEEINLDENPVKNERGLRYYLSEKKFTPAMQDFLIDNIKKSPMRYFVCDDSGSMGICDGSRLDEKTKRVVECSRWRELVDTMRFQMEVSNKGLINSKFDFINGSTLNFGNEEIEEDDYDEYLTLGGGRTPLCFSLNKIIDEIKPHSEYYKSKNKLFVVVISTDGEASDGDLKIPLRELKELPVKLTLRLCTNDEKVVEYWNSIDKELELNLDVVDDYVSEAKEIQSINKWLTYGVQLHRLREFGLVSHEIDKLDELRSDNDSVCKMAKIVFGSDSVDEYSSLTNDEISELNEKYKYKTINPFTNEEEFWIKNNAIQNPNGGCCTIC
jgi:hypothetical protein